MKSDIYQYYQNWFHTNAIYMEWAKKHRIGVNALFILYMIQEYPGECTQRFLCDKLVLPKQTVNTILDSFEKQGYVTKAADTKDRRKRTIAFTEKGQIYAEKILTDLYRFEENAFQNMMPESRLSMLENNRIFLEELARSLEAWPSL